MRAAYPGDVGTWLAKLDDCILSGIALALLTETKTLFTIR